MQPRDGYIPGVPCWIDTSQPDPKAAREFYGDLFGWEFENIMPPGAPAEYHAARLAGGDVAAVAPVPEGTPPRATWNTYIWVDSVDETTKKVVAAGGRVLREPFDVMSHGRMAALADPEGAAFCLWEAREHRGSQVVNEPGSLNFNELHTRDPEGAKSFYGSVFGWETFSMGDSEPFWALPGYGDHLEERYPGTRDGAAEMGVPGFEDVVASLVPIPDDQPDSAHWGVVFAVADADATAERVTQLGGEVVVPPFDAPWVKMTVLTDPQGATFTASHYVPENKELDTES